MKYRIIGTDGKTYGPTDLDQVRRWIAEGRADNRTPVYVEGAASWTYLGLLPELAAQFAAPPPAGSIARAGTKPARGTNGFATAGLICGLLSWACCFCCCNPFGLLGVVFSIIGLLQINSQNEPKQEGRMFAIAGLILAGASLLVGAGAILWQLVFNPGSVNWEFHAN
jgi:hypothetical protein